MSSANQVTPQPSCDDPYDPALLSVDGALKRIAETVSPISDVEVVALRQALDRVLAADVHSPIEVPNHTNSAMDGYALRFADLAKMPLQVIGTAWAGRAFNGSVGPGESVRIMTGAVLPDGADTVVMQEHVERDDDLIRVAGGQREGQHVRHAGEDLARGVLRLVLDAGCWQRISAWWHRWALVNFPYCAGPRSLFSPMAMSYVRLASRWRWERFTIPTVIPCTVC